MPDNRDAAHEAARAIRAAIADPASAGERSSAHLRVSRSKGNARRGVWLITWANVPCLVLDAGRRVYTHVLLPGWEYTPRELRTEMLEDLERLADTGEQPKVMTR